MYDPGSYLIASHYFVRFLGAIYLFAFFPFLFQIRALLGEKGILPAKEYLQMVESSLGSKCYKRLITLFWIDASDNALIAVVAMGCIGSLLLMMGIYPLLLLPLLYILYLSIIGIGQVFLSFGWELFLMEITANAFLLSLSDIPNPFVWISINFLLFRFHLQAGAVKLQSGDPNWRNLTALCYHYQTQPIPNALAWYAHKMPIWFHKTSCLIMLLIEIVIAFGLFGGEDLRFFVFICFFSLQFFIWMTGNFSYLNYMTVVLSLLLVSDTYLSTIFEAPSLSLDRPSLVLVVAASIGGVVLFTLQLMSLWHHFFRNPIFEKILYAIHPYFIVNRYGIFAVMTTKRMEVVIEGSTDGTEWREYLFKHKPSEVERRPRRISPYQPRLDWQAWFLPFGSFYSEYWFQKFLYKLLCAEPSVLSLLRSNPFSDDPPRYIRALMYEYTFTDRETKKRTGQWWNRVLVNSYTPVLTFKEGTMSSDKSVLG